MRDLTARLLQTTRKKLFSTKPVYVSRGIPSEQELSSFETEYSIQFPPDLQYWLLHAGFGEFRDQMLIDSCWFNLIENGDAKGHFIFAQDELGNFYSFPTGGTGIYFLSRRTLEWSNVADTFKQFLEDLEERNFEICDWSMTLPLEPCTRSDA